MAISAKRAKATKQILDLMIEFDKITKTNKKEDISNFNELYWKDRLTKMSENEFTNFMKDLNNRKENLSIDINMTGETNFDLNKVQAIAKKFNIKLVEHVFYPHMNPKNPDNPAITSTPVPIVYVAIRKLQQMLEKKNTAASDTDEYNPLTGQVTGDSRSAGISDTQTFALVATNQTNAVKEFLGPRADDFEAKMRMMRDIERNGEVKAEDLNIKAKNKQSLNTADAFFTGMGFKTDLLKETE